MEQEWAAYSFNYPLVLFLYFVFCFVSNDMCIILISKSRYDIHFNDSYKFHVSFNKKVNEVSKKFAINGSQKMLWTKLWVKNQWQFNHYN